MSQHHGSDGDEWLEHPKNHWQLPIHAILVIPGYLALLAFLVAVLTKIAPD